MGLSSEKKKENKDTDALSSNYDLAEASEVSTDTFDSFLDSEDEDISCLTDLDGKRILPIRKLSDTIQNNMCCKKCVVENFKNYFKKFLRFTVEYENRVAAEERNLFFRSHTERLEWRLDHQLSTSQLFS